jgi:hypothetical protein
MSTERVHYSCVCDEDVSLRCSNRGCGNEISPEGTLVITPDGSVYCSESCVDVVAAASA